MTSNSCPVAILSEGDVHWIKEGATNKDLVEALVNTRMSLDKTNSDIRIIKELCSDGS